MPQGGGILGDWQSTVAKHLGLHTVGGRVPIDTSEALSTLCRGRSGLGAPESLAHTLFNLAVENRRLASAHRPGPPSRRNWEFRRRIGIDADNPSDEVTLERAIVRGGGQSWGNQIPTSSGFIDRYLDGHRNIDLVKRLEGGRYEFIELKWKSNTPLYAGFEILSYGILYLFCRVFREEFKYSDKNYAMLDASAVHLRVLAPRAYYGGDASTGHDLQWLEEWLNRGISTFADEKCGEALTMDFAFLSFPDDFAWSATLKGDSDDYAGDMAERRTRLYPPSAM